VRRVAGGGSGGSVTARSPPSPDVKTPSELLAKRGNYHRMSRSR